MRNLQIDKIEIETEKLETRQILTRVLVAVGGGWLD